MTPGCDNCYARVFAKRMRNMGWGKGTPRIIASEAVWNAPMKWDAAARRDGVRRRVFCASMADVFDSEVAQEHRDRLWGIIAATQNLDWLILTKRPQNMRRMLPADWAGGGYRGVNPKYGSVWLGTSIEAQEFAKARLRALLEVPASVHFLSCEPLIGPLTLAVDYGQGVGDLAVDPDLGRSNVDWVIVGGESGHGARPLDVAWVRALRDEVTRANAAFFFKQYGKLSNNPDQADATAKENGGGTKGGRMLDGRVWDEFPKVRVVA